MECMPLKRKKRISRRLQDKPDQEICRLKIFSLASLSCNLRLIALRQTRQIISRFLIDRSFQFASLADTAAAKRISGIRTVSCGAAAAVARRIITIGSGNRFISRPRWSGAAV
jgi:hypothetical protein